METEYTVWAIELNQYNNVLEPSPDDLTVKAETVWIYDYDIGGEEGVLTTY